MDEDERQRPSVTVLDVASLAPIEVYGVLATLATDPAPAVQRALSAAVERILSRTRVRDPRPPAT